MFTCPVCYFDQMFDPPLDYNICPCCGTEFGNDDQDKTYAELRHEWVANGANWFFGFPPFMWDAQVQLAKQVQFWQEVAYSALGVNRIHVAASSPSTAFVYTVRMPEHLTVAPVVSERRQRRSVCDPEVVTALAS